jgi:uncharacterized protein (UPF0332 family)
VSDLSRAYLTKANACLKGAALVARIGLHEAAGRAAYPAAYHAAQAFILARSGKIVKTHSGARSEFARLARNEPALGRDLTAFLAQTYNLKIADYEVGPNVAVTANDVDEAIAGARRFVKAIEQFMAQK